MYRISYGHINERVTWENLFQISMDITFRPLTINDIITQLPYYKGCMFHLSDYSAAFKYMWQEYFAEYFTVVEDCLVFKEYFQGRTYFYYPLSMGEPEKEERALDAIEEYCRQNNVRLHYTGIPEEKIPLMIARYGSEIRLNNKRRWRDYFYDAQSFVTYAGKKYSGQRNHVNKFNKLYNYEYCALTEENAEEIKAFLKEFSERQIAKGTNIAREEYLSVYKLTDYLDALNLLAGGIRVDGKLISYAVGEVCGDQLIIHVEKALTQYEGIYATTAHEFAKHNVTENIKYINREDDAGDAGLRKSKLQYNPIALIGKFNILPHRVIDNVAHLPKIFSENIVLREITEINAKDLFRLEYDAERNKYWGYNWREHFSGEPDCEYFLNGLREDFKEKQEMPLGIFCKGVFAGEVVLHNFGYRNDCEIGVRLLPEFEGRGIAKEALKLYMDYAFFDLDVDTVLAKCYKQNERSKYALLAAGMKYVGDDDTFYYFKKTAAM